MDEHECGLEIPALKLAVLLINSQVVSQTAGKQVIV